MKNLFISLLLFTGSVALATGTNYNIIPNESVLKFSIKNFAVPTNGTLDPPTGTIVFDEKDLDNSKFDVDVNVNSVNTKLPTRDEHLRSADFFEVEKYPSMHFTSTRIVRAGQDYIAYGTLTIKGHSQEVGMPFSFTPQGSRAVFDGSLVIKRRDYGVGKKYPTMGNDVKIFITVTAGK